MCDRDTDNVPQGFLDILDAEDESDSDYELVQDESEHLDCPDSVQTSFVLVDKTLQAGSYMLVDGVLKPAPESMLIEENLSCSDTDGEEDVAHWEVSWATSPVTLRSLQPNAGDEPVASCSGISFPCGSSQLGADDESVDSGSGRGCSAAPQQGIRGRRGRGNYFNSGSSGENLGVRRSVSRGEQLVQCYATDEDLPQPLREEIVMLNNTERTVPRQEMGNIDIKRESEDANDDYASVSNEQFVWKSMNEWHGIKETFLTTESSGPARVFEDEYDAFRSYWDDSLLNHISEATNKYAQRFQSDKFKRNWFSTNLDEMLVLFAFWIMLGIVKMPTVRSCFSRLTILRTDIFRSMFSEDRYWNLNRAFHLANGSHDADNRDNVLDPMGPVLDALNSKFKENYRLQQDICIGESLTLWKGPLRFRQCIRSKSAPYGIKIYQLCESSTGYLWSMLLYTGHQMSTSTASSSFSIVMKLVEPLLYLGHVLYMDNWFNSPTLARYLKRRKTDCVGTLQPIRKNVPAVIQRAPLARGQFLARQCGDVMVCSLQDRKRVTCISTFHDLTQIQQVARPGRASQFKLKLIDDYNRNVGGVDRFDQTLEPYLVERKQCAKWTKKLFKRLLSITIQNARILLERTRNSKIDSLSFRLALVQSIMDRHRGNVPQRRAAIPQRPHVFRSHFPAGRLTGRHFVRRIAITQQMRDTVKHASNLGRRQCVWCTAHGRRKKSTVYECPQCEMALCLEPCFEEFHTVA